MKFCPNCGAKLARPGEDQFCMNCGAKIPVIPMEEAPGEAVAAPGGPAFSGVPVSPQAAQAMPTAPPPQPRGEDLLNMIEEAQGQAAAPPPAASSPQEDLFAGGLFNDAQPLPAVQETPVPGGAPADLFAAATPPPETQGQNMFNTEVMQSVKPPLGGGAAESHPQPPAHALPRPAAAVAAPGQPPAFAQPTAPPQAAEPAQAPRQDLFATEAGPLFQPPAQDPQPPLGGPVQDPIVAAAFAAAEAEAMTGQPDLFDTAAMLAAQDGSKEVFHPSARRPAPPHGTAAQHVAAPPHTASGAAARPRPMREQAFGDTQNSSSPAKPRRTPPPPVALPEPAMEIKKPSVIGRVLTGFAILIIFLVVCACTILVMLYFQNRPAKTIDSFTTAVAEADVAELNKLATVNGVTPTDGQWLAFCAAFSQKADLNTLKSQLLMMAEETDNADYAYPAVTIEGAPFILFIERYKVHVQAVSMVAPGAVPGTVARLNEVDYTGTPQADGELFAGLMPGRYQCRLVPPGVDAQNVPPTDIEIFGVDGHNYLEGETPRVALTISNCASDDAILYVDEQPVQEKPVGGVVTIPNVALGSTIRIAAIKDGVQMDASIVFSDLNTLQLAFGEYVTTGQPPAPASTSATGEAPTAEEINTVMGAFYQSYLECINQQSMSGIQNTTEAANTALGARIKSTDNAGNLYQYTGVVCDAESIKTVQSGELTGVQFNAQFQFGHKPREGEAEFTAATNYQSVELVLQDGKWLVNKMTFVSEGDFGSHTLATFE